MANHNCLVGISCPNCGQEDQFYVTCTLEVGLTDNGVDDDYAFKYGDGYSWGSTAPIRCGECDHTGKVSDFTAPAQQVAS